MTFEEIEKLVNGGHYHRLTAEQLAIYKRGTMERVNRHFDRLSNDPEYAAWYQELYLRVMYPYRNEKAQS